MKSEVNVSRGLQWILGVSAVLVALAVVASTILPFFFPQTGWGGYGTMGPGHMYGGGSMMGGLGMMSFFGIGMFLVPLLVIGLIVLGVVWLVRSGIGSGTPSAPQQSLTASRFCQHCGKPLQAEWKACPYCGEKTA